jgi:asparagine synthase (glutamine-hydrolysing)
MCGLAGFAGPGDRTDIERMTAALAHRGPDGDGFHLEPEAGLFLGHRRLAIIDIAHGAQPMWDAERETAIIYNGEIYNHAELRAELEARGHRFLTSHSDTEVLLQGYRAWGEELPARLNGMFAFCIYDRARCRLFLARDRFGEKPLYWYRHKGLFAFASELTALLGHRRVEAGIEPLSLQKYFAHGFVPAPHALYRHCRKLPGGWRMSVDLATGETRSSAYWRFRLRPDPGLEARGEAELAEELRALLFQAVRRRLIADVPLGLFLSGGIDSSGVLAGAAAAMPVEQVKTFTIGFREASFDEASYARQVASRFGSRHRERILDLAEARSLAPGVLQRLDEPLADGSIMPTHLLSRFTREEVTVALSGDGGDELFAGYDPFAALGPADLYDRTVPASLHRTLRALIERLPRSERNMSLDFKLRRALAGLSYDKALWNIVWLAPLEPRDMAELFAAPAPVEEIYSEVLELWRDGEAAGLSVLERSLEFYTRFYLQDDVLMKVDRAAMMCSLETRAVFLDNDLVAFAERLPTRFKQRGRERKALLKTALAGDLPRDILRRPKKGFGIPAAAWLRQGLPMPEFEPPAGMKPGLAARRLAEHRSGSGDHRLFLWAWLALAHRLSAASSARAAA